MTVVFMFPGQSSRYDGMLGKMAALLPANAQCLEEASDLLCWDLASQFREGNEGAYRRNVDVQVSVFLASHMMLNVMNEAGITADYSLGLSLGEYNHLVHIGALPFGEALQAVHARGHAYGRGPAGSMIAVQPLSAEELETVVEEARQVGRLEIVNFNSPSQNVLSGTHAAIERAMELIERDHFAQSVVIEKQVPMHASMFEGVATEFRSVLERLHFQPVNAPYLPNRLGALLPSPNGEDFVELLSSHICSPVLWRQSIETLIAKHGSSLNFVEVGPLAVLRNLLSRKWCKVNRFHTDSANDIREHLDTVLATLRRSEGESNPESLGPQAGKAVQCTIN